MVRIIGTIGPPDTWLDKRRVLFFIEGLLWGVIGLYKGDSFPWEEIYYMGGGGLYSIYEGGKMTRGNLDHTTPEYIWAL